jgi:hypothetical protein
MSSFFQFTGAASGLGLPLLFFAGVLVLLMIVMLVNKR